MVRLNSEDFSEFFLCLDILVLTYPDESTHSEVQKNADILSNIREYSWFFDFFEVFHIKLLNPIEPSHVLGTIRFSIKFHVGLSICGHWAWLSNNGFISKTVRKFDFTRVKLPGLTQNQINLHSKASQNHRTIKNSN